MQTKLDMYPLLFLLKKQLPALILFLYLPSKKRRERKRITWKKEEERDRKNSRGRREI